MQKIKDFFRVNVIQTYAAKADHENLAEKYQKILVRGEI